MLIFDRVDGHRGKPVHLIIVAGLFCVIPPLFLDFSRWPDPQGHFQRRWKVYLLTATAIPIDLIANGAGLRYGLLALMVALLSVLAGQEICREEAAAKRQQQPSSVLIQPEQTDEKDQS